MLDLQFPTISFNSLANRSQSAAYVDHSLTASSTFCYFCDTFSAHASCTSTILTDQISLDKQHLVSLLDQVAWYGSYILQTLYTNADPDP